MGNAMVLDSPDGDLSRPTTTAYTEQQVATNVAKSISNDKANGGARPLLERKATSFLEEPITSKHTERGEATVSESIGGSPSSPNSLLRYAVSEMQGWRSHMEDKHALNPQLSTNRQQAHLLKDHHLFAVFDGHGGDFASHYCGEHFVSTLTSQKDWLAYLRLSNENPLLGGRPRDSVAGLSLLKSALTSTFHELDSKLMAAQRKIRLGQLSQLESIVYSLGGTVEHDVFQEGTADHERVMSFDRQMPASMPAGVPLERSGSTGVVVLVTPYHILCANAGDSRAILSRKNEVLPLSFDHKPTNDVEVTRVENDGGFVRAGRVDGDLAVARSFGDFGYKDCGLKNGVGTKITVSPDILVQKRAPVKDEFVVLACDGIWDRLSNKDCSDLVRSLVHEEGETDLGLVCEEIMDTALEMDSRDNMTCCVVMFSVIRKTEQRVNRPEGGVLKRRLVRQESWGHGSTPAKRAQFRLEERREKHQKILEQSSKAKSFKTNLATTSSSSSSSSSSGQVQAHNKAKKYRVSNSATPQRNGSRIRGSNNKILQLQVNSECQSRQNLVAI